MRALWMRTRPAPFITLSVVTRPKTRSRCGQKASSSAPTGPKSIWQASDDTGTCLPSFSISAPIPSPVPGPKISRGPGPGCISGPITCSQSGLIAGSVKAWASKSLSKSPDVSPSWRASRLPSICHLALVSFNLSPSTGPAPQAIRDFGLVSSAFVASEAASARESKSSVLRRAIMVRGPSRCSTSPKRAFVPPTSLTRSGNSNMTSPLILFQKDWLSALQLSTRESD